MSTGDAYIRGGDVKFGKGVYAWFFYARNNCEDKKYFYVGESGGRKNSKGNALARAISYRGSPRVLVNAPYKKLDTDFIVKICIDYLLENGMNCYWEHIDDDPGREMCWVKEYKPIIQSLDTTWPNLCSKFNENGKPPDYWHWRSSETDKKAKRTQEATETIEKVFKEILRDEGITILEETD